MNYHRYILNKNESVISIEAFLHCTIYKFYVEITTRKTRRNPGVRKLILAEFLEELNPLGFPWPKITRGFTRGFFQ